jgi:hypothetical protein
MHSKDPLPLDGMNWPGKAFLFTLRSSEAGLSNGIERDPETESTLTNKRSEVCVRGTALADSFSAALGLGRLEAVVGATGYRIVLWVQRCDRPDF